MSFSQTLGYPIITYRSDNEPTTRQILKLLINARHSLGPTRNPTKLGVQSFLSENAVEFEVERLQQASLKDFSPAWASESDHALWAWTGRHASWVLNRFQPVQGARQIGVWKTIQETCGTIWRTSPWLH